MMDHIRQHDWCSMRPGPSFVDEVDLDNCATERILRNKFHDPMLSSDDEQSTEVIDWDTIFKKKIQQMEQGRKFIPGFHKVPPHPRLSSLTRKEHFQCLKVLAHQYPHVMPAEVIPRPVKSDYRVFEEVAEKYAKEQKEYIEWAKTLWVTTNCIRALRPKPTIETVYEAEYQMKVNSLQSFPKSYSMAAQIPMECNQHSCTIEFANELVKVNISELPEAEYPREIRSRCSVLHACPVPEPCTKHLCRFKLPNESSESILPLTEIHKELAQFAAGNGAMFIASESAVRCMMEMDHNWTLPVSVCEVIDSEGERSNVIVLGSEVYLKKHLAMTRAYKAYRHLLVHAFTSLESKAKAISACAEDAQNSIADDTAPNSQSNNQSNDKQLKTRNRNSIDNDAVDSRRNSIKMCSADGSLDENPRNSMSDDESDNSSDDERLLIDIAEETNASKAKKSKCVRDASGDRCRKAAKVSWAGGQHSLDDGAGLFSCACKGTEFETPRPRSYRSCKVKNATTKEEYNVIVHCSHKLRDEQTELVLEPIPEYQLEVGASRQPEPRLRALQLALLLRAQPDLLNVRIDGVSGDLVTIERLTRDQFTAQYGDHRDKIANILYTTLNQLAGLLPGDYLLQHERAHGSHAMLQAARRGGAPAWPAEPAEPAEPAPAAAEARAAQAPPALAPALLPLHKVRRQLPCAFTTNERQLAKAPQRPPTRRKLPPRALAWPKKKRKRNKKK